MNIVDQKTITVPGVVQFVHNLKGRTAWAVVIIGSLSIHFLDVLAPDVFTPFYILITCIACWCLGPLAGYIVAIGTAALAIAPFSVTRQASPELLILSIVVRLLTYGFVASTLIGFRKLFDRARVQAQHDLLTGALNQESFRARAEEVFEAARETKQTLLLAILDLDDFKELNNSYGHAAGDAALRSFSREAAAIMRVHDHFGRIGGDEFAFLVPVGSSREGRLLATALHQRLSAAIKQTDRPITCSMGAVIIPPDVLTEAAAAMHFVDVVMYSVKRAGKNAVHVVTADLKSASGADASHPLSIAAAA